MTITTAARIAPAPHIQRMQVSALVPSKYNAPSRSLEAPLAQLAKSIALHGVLLPLLVRPVTSTIDGEERVTLEIVAGERRWRAAQIAGLAEVPVILRAMSLLEALELMAIENFQRQELLPIEEADAIEHLLHPPSDEAGLSMARIAEALGRSESHIRETHSLCNLVPPAREAFKAERLTKGTALLIARMPVTIQPKALEALLSAQAKNQGHHLSFKAASELLQGRFMLRLKSAPFRIEADDLVPAAGACSACPKRTGANPDLFSDVAQADTCTDPDCYSTKVDADLELRCAGAEQNGQQVLRGDKALAVLKFGPNSDQLNGDYLYLDRPAPELTDDTRTLAKALKGFTPTLLILHPDTRTLRPIATVETAKKQLKERKLLRAPKRRVGEAMSPVTTTSPPSAQMSAEISAQRRRVEIERVVRQQVWCAISAATAGGSTDHPPGLTRTIRQRLAIMLAAGLVITDELDLLAEEFRWNADNFKTHGAAEMRRLVAGLEDDRLNAFITLALPLNVAELRVHDQWSPTEQPDVLLAIANSPEFAAHVNVAAIREAATIAWHDAHPNVASKPAAPARLVSPSEGEGGGKAEGAEEAAAEAAAAGEKEQAPAAQGNEEPTPWVGSWVRLKKQKRNAEVLAIGDPDAGMAGVLWVREAGATPVPDGQSGPGHQWVNVREVQLLEQQVPPAKEDAACAS